MRASHEVLREVVQQLGAKETASLLGVSLSTVYKWTQPVEGLGSGAINPLDRVDQLMRLSRTLSMIQWLCHRAGGFYVKDPSGRAECVDLLPATNEIVQEFAEMLGIIAKSSEDGSIAPEEARQVRRRWEELKTVTEGFVLCCEHGHFDKLRQAASKPLEEIAAMDCPAQTPDKHLEPIRITRVARAGGQKAAARGARADWRETASPEGCPQGRAGQARATEHIGSDT